MCSPFVAGRRGQPSDPRSPRIGRTVSRSARHLRTVLRQLRAAAPGGPIAAIIALVPTIYVTGHRNPDTDSIASAIGYAELKGRLDPNNEYVPVRLGECNPQTRWVLERSGAPEPRLLPHVLLRACDVMQTSFPVDRPDEPIREAGLAMARAELDLVPIVDERRRAGRRRDRARARPPVHPRDAARPRRWRRRRRTSARSSTCSRASW